MWNISEIYQRWVYFLSISRSPKFLGPFINQTGLYFTWGFWGEKERLKKIDIKLRCRSFQDWENFGSQNIQFTVWDDDETWDSFIDYGNKNLRVTHLHLTPPRSLPPLLLLLLPHENSILFVKSGVGWGGMEWGGGSDIEAKITWDRGKDDDVIFEWLLICEVVMLRIDKILPLLDSLQTEEYRLPIHKKDVASTEALLCVSSEKTQNNIKLYSSKHDHLVTKST